MLRSPHIIISVEFYKFCSDLFPTDLKSKGNFQLEIYIVVKLFDDMCNFKAQISKSFSLLY
jgi:hypothetical protein